MDLRLLIQLHSLLRFAHGVYVTAYIPFIPRLVQVTGGRIFVSKCIYPSVAKLALPCGWISSIVPTAFNTFTSTDGITHGQSKTIHSIGVKMEAGVQYSLLSWSTLACLFVCFVECLLSPSARLEILLRMLHSIHHNPIVLWRTSTTSFVEYTTTKACLWEIIAWIWVQIAQGPWLSWICANKCDYGFSYCS